MRYDNLPDAMADLRAKRGAFDVASAGFGDAITDTLGYRVRAIWSDAAVAVCEAEPDLDAPNLRIQAVYDLAGDVVDGPEHEGGKWEDVEMDIAEIHNELDWLAVLYPETYERGEHRFDLMPQVIIDGEMAVKLLAEVSEYQGMVNHEALTAGDDAHESYGALARLLMETDVWR